MCNCGKKTTKVITTKQAQNAQAGSGPLIRGGDGADTPTRLTRDTTRSKRRRQLIRG